MIRILIPLFFLFAFFTTSFSQRDAGAISLEPTRYVSPVDLNLNQETVEVEYYAKQLSLLKEAYAAKDAGKIAVYESAVLMCLRTEINQLELKLASETAQNERRKSAASGTLTPPSSPDDAPARDPLADAVTPDEVRFETLQYTLAAFQRHSFDASKPEDAARDFAKLDKIQTLMQEALAELKATVRN